jgi:histidinol phosphatase-like PHP family hydrolase
MITEVSRKKFDYVFTDAMTWTNKNGKRMRLWIPEEVEVVDPQIFMDELVENIEKILTEPIDIYVNATFLPKAIAEQYETLWTEERMDRVIQALLLNDVALEIGARYKIPSQAFICRAREAGVKFTFGTNNGNGDYGNLEYCVEMIEACGLTPQDMWYPQ